MKQTKIKNMALIALGSAFLAICSWITLPFAVPFTMQTFGVFLLVLVLGSCRAAVSVLLYILLGAIGIPVFSGFGSGFGTLLGPSGGFILGFLALCGVCMLCDKIMLSSRFARVLALALGLLACYALGVAFYMRWCAASENSIGIGTALSVCVLPYILPDAIKLALAAVVSKRLLRVIAV